MDEARFMAEVEAVEARLPGLPTLQAALLVALREGIASDSRAFARVFGVAHALVLRAVAESRDDLLAVVSRDPRTQRTWLELGAAGRSLFGLSAERQAA